MEKSKKKRYGIVAAVMCLALVVGLGTYAWLTSQSSLTNNFTTAGINTPTTDPDSPDKPLPEDETKVSGNLTETKWAKDSKLTPGESVDKNPNVGLGKGSEDAYVYVYVQNKTASEAAADTDTTYFTISNKWKAVDNQATTVAGDSTHYLGGLFVYVGENGTDPKVLNASETADVWTGELFSQVTTPASTTKDDFAASPSMVVNSYVYAAKDGATGSAEGTAAAAQTGAIAWAKGLSTNA